MSLSKQNWVIGMGILSATAVLVTGCGKKSADSANAAPETKKIVITNSGSDTMVNLAQAWAEAYHSVKPDVSVEVSGGGSGTGIRDLTQGMVDMANSSRTMTDDEKAQAKSKSGKDVVEWMVGYDALGIYVNKNNPINEINLPQLEQIYAEGGTVDLWSQLKIDLSAAGGNDKIVRVSRQNSSGTYMYFAEHVLHKKDFKQGANELSGSKDVVELVSKTPGAIGYSGMGYDEPSVKMLKIAKTEGETAYEPSVANVLNHQYPLARPLLIYTVGQPEGAEKDYIDWILSPAGQDVVQKSGYVPLPKSTTQP